MTIHLQKVKCDKCGHEWIPRVSNPARCPKCKNYNWTKIETETEVSK